MPKSKSLATTPSSPAKLVPWTKTFFSGSPIKLSRGSRAGVIVDADNAPQLFMFDTFAFLDVLSEIDDALADKLSHEEYYSKSANPAGWLINEIEAKLPVNPALIVSLKDAIKEAEVKGWVPFSKIQAELSLS